MALVHVLRPEESLPESSELISAVRAAHQFRLTSPARAVELEARVLARQTHPEIATQMDLSVAVVEAYLACFFDVSDRLHGNFYILRHAIFGRGSFADPPNPATALLHYLAYHGGPVVLDSALVHFSEFASWLFGFGERPQIVPQTKEERMRFRVSFFCRLWVEAFSDRFRPAPTVPPRSPSKRSSDAPTAKPAKAKKHAPTNLERSEVLSSDVSQLAPHTQNAQVVQEIQGEPDLQDQLQGVPQFYQQVELEYV